MIITDRLTFDAPRITSDGFMAVRAKAAKTGIYDYLGSEVDPRAERFKATDTVKVYRSEDEVFSHASVHSFLMKPITDGHPAEAVNSTNWKDHAKGVVAKAMRDGDHLAFDLVLMDAALISAVKDGKRELSNGYQTELVWGDGVTPSGEAYNARQVGISGNHVAVVDRARAGSECRIGDAIAICDAIPYSEINQIGVKTLATKTITFDGISIEVTDQAAQAIEKLQGQVTKFTTDLATAQTQIGTLTASVSTKDGEIAVLKTQVADAAMTPAKLDAAVQARAKVVDAAKKILPTLDAAGKTDAEIRKLVVDAKLAGHALDENGIAGAFAALTVTVDGRDPVLDGIHAAPGAGATQTYQMTIDASRKAVSDMNAWRNEKVN